MPRTARARSAPASARGWRLTRTASVPDPEPDASSKAPSSPGARFTQQLVPRATAGAGQALQVQPRLALEGTARPSPSARSSTASKEELKVHHQRWDGTSFDWYNAFEGVLNYLMRIYKQTESEDAARMGRALHVGPALPEVQRRAAETRGPGNPPSGDMNERGPTGRRSTVPLTGLNINDIVQHVVRRALRVLHPRAEADRTRNSAIAREIVKELKERLGFLNAVGLDYLTLDRTAETLGGGESQRVRLATQIGSGLVGVVYILDEPSIGLHQRDNRPPARDPASGCATSATPSSWSSTTRRPSLQPTTSLTSARARANWAARSWPQGTPEEIKANPRFAHRRLPLGPRDASRCPKRRRTRAANS